MRKSFTIFTMLIALVAGCYAQAWTKITPSISNKQLEDVFFVSPVKGWAVGQTGTILTTSDGGNTWTSQSHPLGSTHLKSVCFTSPTKGWIVGANDTILTTDDAGINWMPFALPGNSDYEEIQFVTPDTGYIAGESGTTGFIKRTYNGGASWQTTNTPSPVEAVYFANHQMGWACGYRGAIYATTNAGVTWTEQKAMGPNITHNLVCLYMISPAQGWAGGNPSNLYYTSDSGNTWVTKASGTNAGKTAIHFFDSLRGWVGTTASLGGAKPLRSTTTGGSPWVIDTIYTSSVFGLAFSGDTLGWAVGENGIILRMGTPPAVIPSAIQPVANTLNTLKVYPNPTYNTLNITSTLEVEQYAVTSLLGQTVLSGQPGNGFQFQLNTAMLPRGTYLLSTTADGVQYFTRFVRD